MLNQSQVESRQARASALEVPSEMRMLTTAELLEVVGGPEIKNGGQYVQVAPTVAIGG